MLGETDELPAAAADPPEFATPARVVAETGAHVPEQQAYLHLMRSAEVLGGQLAELLAGHGLSGKQYNVLRALRRAGTEGMAVSGIAAEMTDPKADVTRLLDRLVRDGLVARAHDAEDRRVVRARLTEAGAQRLAAIDAPLIALHRRQLGHMDEAELASLIRLLRRARGERV